MRDITPTICFVNNCRVIFANCSHLSSSN